MIMKGSREGSRVSNHSIRPEAAQVLSLIHICREYEEKKADADEKIADARQKVADGQKDLDDLEVPKWYILNRDFIQTYVEDVYKRQSRYRR